MKVYLVQSSSGSYEDYSTQIIRAYLNKENAYKSLEEQHKTLKEAEKWYEKCQCCQYHCTPDYEYDSGQDVYALEANSKEEAEDKLQQWAKSVQCHKKKFMMVPWAYDQALDKQVYETDDGNYIYECSYGSNVVNTISWEHYPDKVLEIDIEDGV